MKIFQKELHPAFLSLENDVLFDTLDGQCAKLAFAFTFTSTSAFAFTFASCLFLII